MGRIGEQRGMWRYPLAAVLSTGFGYDIGVDETPFTRRVIEYDYSPLGRLITATYSTGESFEYAYSAVGNRTAYTEAATSTGQIPHFRVSFSRPTLIVNGTCCAFAA